MSEKFIHELSPEEIRAAVADKYGEVAQSPQAEFPFPVGRAFAESLGYLPADLDTLPAHAVDAFAGISCLHPYLALSPGDRGLDLGCGAGLDSIMMAAKVRPDGVVHSLDASTAMIKAARENAAAARMSHIVFHQAPAEDIPLEANSLDVVHVNGMLNLCHDKQAVLAEIRRVLKADGRLYLSEIVRQEDSGSEANSGKIALDSWFL